MTTELPVLAARKPGWAPIIQRNSPAPSQARSSENSPVLFPDYKVLLMNSPYLDVYGKMNVGANHTFPLGLGYVASVLREAGFPVNFFDPEPLQMDWDAIAQHIREEAPQIIGITCATSNFKGALRLARLARENTDATVVFGGVHVTALPEYTLMTYPDIDVIVIGEGEITMPEFCRAVAQGDNDWSKIDGIAYRQDEKIVRTALRAQIENLDILPMPARDLVDYSLYRLQVDKSRGSTSATMVTSRGCPAKCTFCAVGVTMGHGFRVHSPEYVVSEINYLQERYGVEHIVFVDDEFTVGRKRAETLCQEFLDKKLKFQWHCFSRVNDVTPGLLKLMKEAGSTSVLYGIETGDEDILKLMKKGSSLGAARRAVKEAMKIGMKTQCGFIIGNFGDTHETIKKTVNFACELNPTIASFNIMVPFPGTEDWNRMLDLIPEELTNWDNFVPKAVTPIIQLEGLSRQELQRHIYKAYIRFYGRPSQIWRMIKFISSPGEFWAYVRGAFGLVRQIIDWRKQSKSAPLKYPFSDTM